MKFEDIEAQCIATFAFSFVYSVYNKVSFGFPCQGALSKVGPGLSPDLVNLPPPRNTIQQSVRGLKIAAN